MKQEITAGRQTFIVTGPDGAIVTVEEARVEDGVYAYGIEVRFSDGRADGVCLSWTRPLEENLTTWSPDSSRSRTRNFNMWCAASYAKADFYSGTPLFSLIRPGDINFYTVAVEESREAVRLRAFGNDISERGQIHFDVCLLPEGRREGYRTTLRMDMRNVKFYECLRDVGAWWNTCYPRTVACHDACERPLYSNWYNFYQDPDQSMLEKELEYAAAVGMRTLILDDGWSYDSPTTGDYYYSGDWEFSTRKFPDPESFIRKAHDLGIRVMLWFPLPFMGHGAKRYAAFEGRYYCRSEAMRASVLDARYPSVRRDIVRTYCDVVERYGLDGLKLDFIDHFEMKDYGTRLPETDEEARDCGAMREGVARLLTELSEGLRAVKPDIMIEFRQDYIGRAITGYCNMLRVKDCFMDAVINRICVADLRLLHLDLAVHADMLWWPQRERPEVCARHLINVLFSVPQVSVTLAQCPPEQLEVVSSFLHFWDAHRDTILHGAFRCYDVVGNYSVLAAEDENCCIAAAYLPRPFDVTHKTTYLFNATEADGLVVRMPEAMYEVYDCRGRKVATGKGQGLTDLPVPVGGRVGIHATAGT